MSTTVLVIAKHDLLKNRWYVGRGRNFTRIAYWDGDEFVIPQPVSRKVGPGSRDWHMTWGIKRGDHFDDLGGCFQPFGIIDEGVISVPHEEAGYAQQLAFDTPPVEMTST